MDEIIGEKENFESLFNKAHELLKRRKEKNYTYFERTNVETIASLLDLFN